MNNITSGLGCYKSWAKNKLLIIPFLTHLITPFIVEMLKYATIIEHNLLTITLIVVEISFKNKGTMLI